mmetsp:Transcript_74273/g.164005  ORF Transcript_74273/g.164005 Transcript_74273/m.164005 type:complete len:292 (+) Transcript_74273:907-1782(+)
MEGTLGRPLASISALDISFQSRACVAELEHQALGEAAEIDGIGVRNKVKGWVEKFLCCDGDGHARIHQALGVHHRTCDSKDFNVISLLVESLLQVKDQHQNQRMMRRAGNDGVAQNGVWLVLGIRFIGDDEACVLAQLHDGIQRLLPHRDHVRVHVDTSVVPEKFQAQDVGFALPHLLFHVDLLVEHGQLGHAFVAPNLVAPVRMGLQVIGAKGIQPQTWRFLGPDPNLVDDLRNRRRTDRRHVVHATALPLLRVLHPTFAAIPVVELADGTHVQLGEVLQHHLHVPLLLS